MNHTDLSIGGVTRSRNGDFTFYAQDSKMTVNTGLADSDYLIVKSSRTSFLGGISRIMIIPVHKLIHLDHLAKVSLKPDRVLQPHGLVRVEAENSERLRQHSIHNNDADFTFSDLSPCLIHPRLTGVWLEFYVPCETDFLEVSLVNGTIFLTPTDKDSLAILRVERNTA